MCKKDGCKKMLRENIQRHEEIHSKQPNIHTVKSSKKWIEPETDTSALRLEHISYIELVSTRSKLQRRIWITIRVSMRAVTVYNRSLM